MPLLYPPRFTTALLEAPPLVPPATVELGWSALHDFSTRMARRQPHVAELFHENSKLAPCDTIGLAERDVALRGFRDWWWSSRPRETSDGAAVQGAMKRLVDNIPREGSDVEMFMAVELYVVDGSRVYRRAPETGAIHAELDLGPEELWALAAAFDEQPREWLQRLFVVGIPWRYIAIEGPRGYRRALVDVGRVLQTVRLAATEADAAITVRQDFYDELANRGLGLDGVERVVMAAVDVADADGTEDA